MSKPRILDHNTLPQREPVVSAGDRVLIDAVGKHLATQLGGSGIVSHDRDSRWVHVDVFVHGPTAERPVTVVSTCGMAERPLRDHRGERVWTELVCLLPPSWPFEQEMFNRPEYSWPIVLLRWLARYPHRVGIGYEPRGSFGPIPFAPGDRVCPYDAALFLAQRKIEPLVMVGREVRFLAVCPLHADELALIREHGTDAMLEAFTVRTMSPLMVTADRASFAAV